MLPKGTAGAPAVVLGQERSLEQQHLTWEAWVKPGRVDTTSRRVMANEEPWGGTLLAARRDGIVFARYLNPGDYQMGGPGSHDFAIVGRQIWGTLTAPLVPGRFTSQPAVTRHQRAEIFAAGAGTGDAGGAYHSDGGTTLAPFGSPM